VSETSPAIFAHASFAGSIGVAREDITPPAGIYARNWGASQHDLAEGVHRPLLLTVLTFQQQPDDSPLVLVGIDGGWWKTHEDEWRVRRGLVESIALDRANVILHLSHTHAGPSLCCEDRDKPGGHLIERYLDSVREAAVRAARRAMASSTRAILTWGQGKCTLAHNRAFALPGTDHILCGLNPVFVADDTLVVGRVTDSTSKVLATILNYACHPTTLAWENRLISPDFVGAAREVVESRFGGAPCLFLQGASGELAPAEQYVGDLDVADKHGRQLGYATLEVLEAMLPPGTALEFSHPVESGARLAVWKHVSAEPSQVLKAVSKTVELPLKEFPALEEIERHLKNCADRVIEERLRRTREVRRLVGNGQTMSMEFWVWRLGEAIVIGQPNEAFSELQTKLRSQFAPRPVVVMNLVNGGEAGYLPVRTAYDRDMYEVNQTPLARGSLERFIGAAISAIQQLLP
jgi:Neutral/alkaline non-lysosomal ceramidase, N-terminal